MKWRAIKLSVKKNTLATMVAGVKQIITVVIAILVISVFIIQAYDINDVSMEPTFDPQGNRVLIFLTPYIFGANPDYGEIVIVDSRVDRHRSLWDRFIESPLLSLVIRVRSPHLWVKRVIGLPGDRLEFRDGRVYRNGRELIEGYIKEEMIAGFDTVTVPEGHVFVMGDNRNRSIDSRMIGPVPSSNIQGRVILRFYPLSKISSY